jgi:hypothetical protein
MDASHASACLRYKLHRDYVTDVIVIALQAGTLKLSARLRLEIGRVFFLPRKSHSKDWKVNKNVRLCT